MQYHRVPVREDSVIKENQNIKTSNKCHLYSILSLTTFFIFVGSIIDLIFSYSFINNCQTVVDPHLMITIDMWLRVSGIIIPEVAGFVSQRNIVSIVQNLS